MHRQKVYCKPIWLGYNTHFDISESTGLIDSPEPFEEENGNEEYMDTVRGYTATMILQHRLGTAGIVNMKSVDYSGEYRICSGKHQYDGLSATTEFKCIADIKTTIDASKTETPQNGEVPEANSSGNNAVDRAVAWAVQIANDDSHKYSQSTRWGPHYDCSSFVISAYTQAGVNVKAEGATYTGNMRSAFLKKGFKDVTKSINLSTGAGTKKGDVLLNTADHAAMVRADGGAIVHASSPSNGICLRGWYNYPWNYVLRYGG